MSIITALPGWKRSVVYPFCLFTLFGPFFMKLAIMFSAILNLGRFGDHVLLFSGSTAMMMVFQASYSQISCDYYYYFSPHRPTQNQETYSTLNEKKREWPKPYGFFTTLLLRISVYLSFVLYCSFSVGEITETETVQTPSIFPLEILGEKKWKARWFIDPKGNGVGLGLVTAAPVHSWAVKWSRKTKGP